ncbi:FAD-dependent thymidylate synthase [Nonomuraea roseoviolacea subsp. roseoviolacea]|uniref:FAD-dependent thymidylate synthase n=1 Tax=Nonomuraea roseoviolacea TaxID=103837 RepID=UPI0031E02C86
MEVKLLAYSLPTLLVAEQLDSWDTEDQLADELSEYAGRICYKSKRGANPATATNEGYLANIIKQEHFSVLEHASATFLVEGVSRHLLGELTRHRHLSFSVESLRYCPPTSSTIHPTIHEHDLVDVLARAWAQADQNYKDIYDALVEKGLPKKQAREAAAQVLPLSTSTDLVVTGNFRAWRDVIGKRLDPAANREIRQLADIILNELKDLAPNSFQDFEDGVWA